MRAGQEVFLRNGLMQYGSIFGHGAYLGPDFTADYLHRAAVIVETTYGGTVEGARQKTIDDFRTNTYDAATGTLVYTDAQAEAFESLVRHYHDFFADPVGDTGLRPSAITDPDDTRHLTAYFSWSGWVAATERPGKDHSYTNNWPPKELVANSPSPDVVVWSVLSLVALLTGIGALLAVFGRWNWLGWHGRDQQEL